MSQNVLIRRNKQIVLELDSIVFTLLFNHTIVRRTPKYQNALSDFEMDFESFIQLTRAAEVPYPLFFLDKSHAQKMIEDYEKKVYFGVSKRQISIASRGDIELADISLIIKDITRKQGYIKEFITAENRLSGILRKSGESIEEKAARIRELVGLDLTQIEKLNKEKTFEYLSSLLSKENVFVSLYTDHYTPQRIERSLYFSGIAINDKKCPFLFIKAGDSDSAIEPWGRRIFTIALLISTLCHGDYGPVTMDGKCRDLTKLSDKHFLFAEEFLMPKRLFEKEIVRSRADIDHLAVKYSISPSAIVMRAVRVGVIKDDEVKAKYLDQLQDEWNKILSKKGGGNQIASEKAVNRYNNPAVVSIILKSLNNKRITSDMARNLLCYKKGEKLSLPGLPDYGK